MMKMKRCADEQQKQKLNLLSITDDAFSPAASPRWSSSWLSPSASASSVIHLYDGVVSFKQVMLVLC
jgi:hypothetical protein